MDRFDPPARACSHLSPGGRSAFRPQLPLGFAGEFRRAHGDRAAQVRPGFAHTSCRAAEGRRIAAAFGGDHVRRRLRGQPHLRQTDP